MGYSTGVFFIPDSASLDFVAMATLPQAPDDSRAGYMIRIGEGLWHVSLAGRGDQRPPGDVETFLAFASTLPTQTIANALEFAGLPDEIARFGFRASIRRHFDAASLPHGLLPVGDSLCRFNPVYGQGMSVAAQEARLLRDILAKRAGTPAPTSAPLAGLAGEFLAGADALIAAAWEFSAIPDYAYPQTEGERPADLEEKLRLQGEMFGRAMEDPEAHRALMERMHLLAPPVPAEARRVEAA
jgi:2-polyprenyl-6-methoxyphenol hydroxylase-like FAD-dependent oxidoreductase